MKDCFSGIYRKLISLCLMLIIMVMLFPSAFAEQYRLKETVSGNYRLSRTEFFSSRGNLIDVTEYFYDEMGLLSRTEFFSGDDLIYVTEYFYNKDNQLVEERETSDIIVLVFHYDSNGTRIEQTNSGLGGDLFWAADTPPTIRKDADGRVVEIRRVSSETLFDVDNTFRYTYDSKGRIKTYEVTDCFRDEFIYNKDGSFFRTRTDLWTKESKVIERYNASGLLVERVDEHDIIWNYYYDQKGMLTNEYYSYALDDNDEYVTHYSYSYEYDENGNVSAKITFGENGVGERTEYIYEAAGGEATANSTGVSGTEHTGSLSGFKKIYFLDAVATSELQEGGIRFIADYAINKGIYYPWVEGVEGDGIGQSITMKFKKTETFKILGFQIGYAATYDQFEKNNRPKTVRISFDDGSGFDYTFRDVREEQYIMLSDSVTTSSVKVEILDVYPGTECDDTCIYMVRAFR